MEVISLKHSHPLGGHLSLKNMVVLTTFRSAKYRKLLRKWTKCIALSKRRWFSSHLNSPLFFPHSLPPLDMSTWITKRLGMSRVLELIKSIYFIFCCSFGSPTHHFLICWVFESYPSSHHHGSQKWPPWRQASHLPGPHFPLLWLWEKEYHFWSYHPSKRNSLFFKTCVWASTSYRIFPSTKWSQQAPPVIRPNQKTLPKN